MKPSIKRTIITSKTTGRRYFLVRSSNRPSARRYYVCSKPDCDIQLTHVADFFCRIHSQGKSSEIEDIANISTKLDFDEEELNDNSEIVDEEVLIEAEEDNTLDSTNGHEQNENGTNDSAMDYDYNDGSNDFNNVSSLSSRQRTKANRHVEVDEETGIRSFRDSSGRRRYLCKKEECTNMLKRQSDIYCRTHEIQSVNGNQDKNNRGNQKRHTAPPLSLEKTGDFLSPLPPKITAPINHKDINGNHSDEYESPEKTQKLPLTNRSYRDGSGKIRFLCGQPSCTRQVPRKAQIFCTRHDPNTLTKELEHEERLIPKNDTVHSKQKAKDVQEIDVNHSNTDNPPESIIKKRRYEALIPLLKPSNLSLISADKIVISTTSLLAHQWANVVTFLRQFPQVGLATNLNVNNSTTHLLIDDSEKNLHCTITKKIVQAAARRHIFMVSSRWINECIRLNAFVDERPFEIASDSHTTLRLSVQDFQSKNKYLFNDPSSKTTYGFTIECRQCQGSINRNEIIELIELTGAKLYNTDSPIDTLIVLCDTNEKNLNKIKEKYLHTAVPNIKYIRDVWKENSDQTKVNNKHILNVGLRK
ncbi:unnamed protein product [Rotaria socialis]